MSDDDWQDDLYLAGRKCAICGSRILDDSTIPTCYPCGWTIAQEFAERILAEDRARSASELRKRHEQARSVATSAAGGWVYYVRIADYIKIGFTTQVQQRMRELRVEQGDVLAIEPGGPELERQRHREFRSDRLDVRRENFRPSEHLLAHIESVREQHPMRPMRPNTSRITRRRVGE